MERKADFGGILGETVSLFRDGFRGVLIYVLVVGGLSVVGIAFELLDPSGQTAGFQFGFPIDATAGLPKAGFQLLMALVSIVASYFLIAHFLESQGRLPSRETRIWSYVGLSILTVLGLVVGFILLIVPGLILLVRWSAAPGYLIAARLGVVESLSASWNATKGHSWPIFGAGLVVLIGSSVIGGMIGALIGGFLGFLDSLQWIGTISGVAGSIGNAIGLALTVAVFMLVHKVSDGIGEVFA